MTLRDTTICRAWAAFIGLPETHTAISALADATQVRQLRAGEILLHEADEDAGVFLIAAGTLRTVRHTGEGQEVWFTDAKRGELIGEIAALTGQPRTSNVTAQDAVIVYGVEQAAFMQIAQSHGEVGLAVARLLAHRLVKTSTQVADLAALTVQNRLHRELVRLATPGDGGGNLVHVSAPPSVTELGQRIHATREATSRALRDLEARGLVARSGDTWMLLVPDAARLPK